VAEVVTRVIRPLRISLSYGHLVLEDMTLCPPEGHVAIQGRNMVILLYIVMETVYLPSLKALMMQILMVLHL
jgi:hypothetical protein